MGQGQSLNYHKLGHPILLDLLTRLRDKETRSEHFRNLMEQISLLLTYEATKTWPVQSQKIATPLEETEGQVLKDQAIIVSIMRAGNGMINGALSLLPRAPVGHIGIYRDKFINNTVEYFFRLPSEMTDKPILLLDPLLASGHTALAAINRLKDYEVGPISFLCILGSPQGIELINEHHKDVEIFCVGLERELNADDLLLPGIGDVGNRLYGAT